MIRFKPKRTFILPTEVLMLKVPHTDGFYFMETDAIGRTILNAADAFKGTDDFTQAIRFDMESLKGEDVTEDCAEAWLDRWHGAPDETVPPFVKHSEAFQVYSAEYERAHPRWRGPDPDQQRQEWLDDEYRVEAAE